MDTTYINPALEAIVEVMKTMAHQELTRGEIILKQNDLAFGEVSSVINMDGESGQGTIAVSFPLVVIMKLANIMLPPDTPRNNEMIRDLTGEMANMFAGSMKAKLEENQLKFNISLPAILAGKPHHIKHLNNQAAIFIPFSCEIGSFFVEICFDTKVIH